MFNLIKINLLSVLITLVLSYSNAAVAVTAAVLTACAATGTIMTADGQCRFTPSKYEVTIFEMGVCTANPMTTDDFNTAVCSKTFTATDQTNGFTADMAETLGGSIDLTGTSSRPANGTYKYPYIIMKNTFKVQASFVHSGATYYLKNNGTVTTSAPAQDLTSTLSGFGNDNCDGEYLKSAVDVGFISGYLTNTALNKRDSSDISGSSPNRNCGSGTTRLVGIMELTAPFTISPSTLKMQFTFNITGYGAQFFDDAGSNSIPDQGGSGPFSGFFEVTDGGAQ